MTMHMVHAGLSTTNDKPRKKKPSPAQQKAKAEHEAWLRKQGIHPDQLAAKAQPKSKKLTSWRGAVDPGAPCSNTVVDGGAVRSVFNSHWQDRYKDDPLMAEREREALAKAAVPPSELGYVCELKFDGLAVNLRTRTGWYIAPNIFRALSDAAPGQVQAATGQAVQAISGITETIGSLNQIATSVPARKRTPVLRSIRRRRSAGLIPPSVRSTWIWRTCPKGHMFRASTRRSRSRMGPG